MTDANITLIDDWRTGQRCPRAKRRLWARTVESVDTILVHATAVAGGFGVGRLDAAAGRAPKVRFARNGAGIHDTAVMDLEGEDRDAELRLDTRLYRYRGTPYHGLYSPRDRASVVQWPATDVTYHGNKPNSCSLGWAYDGLFTPTQSDDLDVEGARASLRHLISQAREQGCLLRRIAPHANHAPPPRYAKPYDPGARVWLEVVVHVAVIEGLELAADWVTGGAEPWARRWMEVAA